MKTPEELSQIFERWKAKKGENLLKLYQEKYAKEANGEDCSTTEEKIRAMEKEISQRQEELERKLGRLYKRMYRAGASSDAKKIRNDRTHHLCNLGGLVEKAGLGEMEAPALLGMLLHQAEYLKSNPGILSRWTERGQAALNVKEE